MKRMTFSTTIKAPRELVWRTMLEDETSKWNLRVAARDRSGLTGYGWVTRTPLIDIPIGQKGGEPSTVGHAARR